MGEANLHLARRRMGEFAIASLVLLGCFWAPLSDLVGSALKNELHSYTILIPIISAYLVWLERSNGPFCQNARSMVLGGLFALIGGLSLWFWRQKTTGTGVNHVDWLWLSTLSFLAFFLAGGLFTLGWARMSRHQFALAFLVFLLPLPSPVTEGLSQFLQSASAEVSDWTLRLTGLPVLRTGMIFQFPGLTIQVAEECSGIRSSLVLFIVSVLAGKMFLRASWRRAVLALVTLPLGIFRNAFRITTLSWLSVNVDSEIIHGPLHHQGGPVFFALSLLPLFLLLWRFRKTEAKASTPNPELS